MELGEAPLWKTCAMIWTGWRLESNLNQANHHIHENDATIFSSLGGEVMNLSS